METGFRTGCGRPMHMPLSSFPRSQVEDLGTHLPGQFYCAVGGLAARHAEPPHTTEAVSLDRKISEQTDRLKELKTKLVDAAHEHEDELTPPTVMVFAGRLRATTAASPASTFPHHRSSPKSKAKANRSRKSSSSPAQFSTACSSPRSASSRSKTSAMKRRRCSRKRKQTSSSNSAKPKAHRA